MARRAARPRTWQACSTSHGSGAIVNSSRGIIGAWKKSGKYSEAMTADEALDLVASSARKAAQDMRDNLRVAVYR